MAWGYWGVVTGLALLSGLVLYSVAWIYASAHDVSRVSGDLDGPDLSSESDTEQKRAA
ncbi:MAG: hypothetical protein ICV75_03475 [Nitrospiraceae bacterium]|jgi:hypothetical protein|nr:hypothetical protein [Nitrospiraceae bacterium]